MLRVQDLPSAHLMELLLPEAIDPMEFDRLNETVLQVLDGKAKEHWVLDLTSVTYMGSAMLGLIVNIRHRVKAGGGKLVLCNMSAQLAEIFRMCSMERLFTIAKTRPDALKSLGQ
ncbi:MAG TPA: STAS domain-containing protein [Tepidisphaeraceae bacterium]|nr:STAS domain-containing protein [Tepidisphaeraceae bacterium]